MQELGVSVLFSIGIPSSSMKHQESLLREESVKFQDILRGNFVDTYDNLTLKSLMIVKWVAENCPTIRAAFFTDLDTLVLPDRLFRFARKNLTENTLAGACLANQVPFRDPKNKW